MHLDQPFVKFIAESDQRPVYINVLNLTSLRASDKKEGVVMMEIMNREPYWVIGTLDAVAQRCNEALVATIRFRTRHNDQEISKLREAVKTARKWGEQAQANEHFFSALDIVEKQAGQI